MDFLEILGGAIEEAVNKLQKSRRTANVLETTEEESYIQHDNSGMFVTKPETTSELTVSNREEDPTNYIFLRARHTVQRYHEGVNTVTKVHEFRESTPDGKTVACLLGTDSKKVIWKRPKVETKPGKIRLDNGRYFFLHSGRVFESTKHAGFYLACKDRVLFLKKSDKVPKDDPEVSFTVDPVHDDDRVDSGFFESSLVQQHYSGSVRQLQQCMDLDFVNFEQTQEHHWQSHVQ